jgi:acid phosphatase type 7
MDLIYMIFRMLPNKLKINFKFWRITLITIIGFLLLVLGSIAGFLFREELHHHTIYRYVSRKINPNQYVILVGAGDIASRNSSGSTQTAKLIQNIIASQKKVAVFTAGDNVNETPVYFPDFIRYFDPTWGKFKNYIHPALGNHDYTDKKTNFTASGYYQYFGFMAGDPKQGYYSYDWGTWHIIVINSNCKYVSCRKNSPQEIWLRSDLADHRDQCTLAYWHHPFTSSGIMGSAPKMADIWQDLYDYHIDIVVNGHNHDYERFARVNPQGQPDPNGIREFVVGTGGKSLYPFRGPPLPQEQVRNDRNFGVLELKLYPKKYDWEFISTDSAGFRDQGTDTCHANYL